MGAGRWLRGGRGTAVLAAVAVGLAGSAAGDRAYAVAGSTADPAFGYVVRVNVGADRSCTGVRLDAQLVATSKECFRAGSGTAAGNGPPAVASTVVTRPDQGSGAVSVAVDFLFVRDDRNLVVAHLAGALTGLRGDVAIASAAPAAGASVRVLGYGRTADEWVPDLPHIAAFTVQDVSTAEIGVAPAGDGAVCKGDAGGPVIRENADGSAALIGVVSTSGQGGCLGETSTRPDATATRVDGLAGWVAQLKGFKLLVGTVTQGTGCLLLSSGGVTYGLTGGDPAVVKAGANLTVGGYPAPAGGTCPQGTLFQVASAVPARPVSMRARVNNKYVTAENAGAEPLIANRAAPGGSWEVFDVFDLGNGIVALRARVNSRYVTADDAGAGNLIAARDVVGGSWEKFLLVRNADGSVSLKAQVNGKYVTAENAGAEPLIANRAAIGGSWERFDLINR